MELTETPPDGGWGWMVVLGAALINMVNQALFSIFGLIFGKVLEDMAGGKATGITLVMAINVMVTNFSGLGVAAILRRISIRSITIIGVTCVGTGMVLSSFATQIYHIVLAYGCLTGLGLGLLASSTFLVITKFFTSRKSTAVGIAMAGTSIGQMLMPLLVGVLIKTYDFAGTTRILGCLSFTGIIGALFFKPLWCFKSRKNKNQDNVEKGKVQYEDIPTMKTPSVEPVEENLKVEDEISNKEEEQSDNEEEKSNYKDNKLSKKDEILEKELDNETVDLRHSDPITAETTNYNIRPPSTNPFDDSEESDAEIKSINEKVHVSQNQIRPPSTNPFGSSSDEDLAEDLRIKEEKQKILSEINNLVAGSKESITNEDRNGIINQLVHHPSANEMNDSLSDLSDDDISTEETNIKDEKDEDAVSTIRPPSTNPFGSYSDLSEAESVGDPSVSAEKQKVLNDIMNLTKSFESDEGREKSKNPFGSRDNMLDVKIVKKEEAIQPFKRQFGRKMSYNPFGSVDEILEKNEPTLKTRHRLFPDQEDDDEDDHNVRNEREMLLNKNNSLNSNYNNGDLKKSYEIMQTTNLQSGSIDINPTYCSSLSHNLGLRLLKDIKFIHLLIGLAFGYVSSVTFSTFFPMFLSDEAKLEVMETTTCMTALSFADIAGRLTISEISKKLKLNSRSVFIIGALVLGISRSTLVLMTDYKSILACSFVVGYCRAATVITQNLVVSEYIGSDDLPAAVGLNMVTKGIFILTLGQSLGYLKDMLSYAWCIHFLDIILYIVAISWTLEIMWSKFIKKSSK